MLRCFFYTLLLRACKFRSAGWAAARCLSSDYTYNLRRYTSYEIKMINLPFHQLLLRYRSRWQKKEPAGLAASDFQAVDAHERRRDLFGVIRLIWNRYAADRDYSDALFCGAVFGSVLFFFPPEKFYREWSSLPAGGLIQKRNTVFFVTRDDSN